MIVTTAASGFRPITIELQTLDEARMLHCAVGEISEHQLKEYLGVDAEVANAFLELYNKLNELI